MKNHQEKDFYKKKWAKIKYANNVIEDVIYKKLFIRKNKTRSIKAKNLLQILVPCHIW